MTMSWPQIRGLSYSTIGRTLRATVHTPDGDSRIWFAPPTRWRIERVDGTPTYIENETDEYRFSDDGVAVHESKSPHRTVVNMWLSPTLMLTPHQLWPVFNSVPDAQLPDPDVPHEVAIRGRHGWQVELEGRRGGPMTVVIDAELGIALSYRQGAQWMELSDPVIDEDFDQSLFAWTGPTMETEEYSESPEQLAHEQKMRDISEMPQTVVGWLPSEIHSSAVDGDPLSGALDIQASAGSTQVAVRRWLTDVGEPEVGFMVDHYPPVARRQVGPWTVELRAYGEIANEHSERMIASLVLPGPPGSPEEIRDAVAQRQDAVVEAEIVEKLGTGRTLADCLNVGYQSLLVRTDFTDDARWRDVVLATGEAGLTCIDNRDNDGLTVEELVERIGEDPPYYAFLADSITMSHSEMPIVALDCGRPEYGHEPGRTFRVIPSEMYSVEANWAISNMGFGDFADSADDDGIFRGFPPSPPVVTTMERDDLIALSTTNRSTPALARFADEMVALDSAYAVIHEYSRPSLHDGVLQLADSDNEIRVGVDDYLAATSRDGICHWGFVQILAGHWSLVIDPETGRLEAAMLRKHRPVEET